MLQSPNLLAAATGGCVTVRDDWMPATGLRSLLLDDPALLWLQFHGAKCGFQKDPSKYEFLAFIGRKGCEFEAKWINEVAPEAIAVLTDDRDVRRADAVSKTLACMKAGHDVISHGALWWAPEKIYGAPDLMVQASWLRSNFPHLSSLLQGPDHYVILDCKFMTGLDDSSKAKDFEIVSAQMQLYSYMLAEIQGFAPKWAFLVTRDRPFDPVPVEINHRLGQALDAKLASLRDRFIHIKLDGADLRPWKDRAVSANYNNEKDAPWHLAKKKIARDYIPGGPLEWLPYVGSKQAEELKRLGVSCLDDLLKSDAPLPFQTINGIGAETAGRIEAVLKANKTGKPSAVSASLVPPKRDVELFVDYEYLTNVNVDFERQWPAMEGCDMIFMAGVAFYERGAWHFKQFVAAREDRDAEREMLVEFGKFLEQKGVFCSGQTSALYHWSPAEISQSARAAERHNLAWLHSLPWQDLQIPFHEGPIALPNLYGFGIKEVAASMPPAYRVKWPEGLSAGLSAMVAGWRAFEQPCPEKTAEMALLSDYLRVDCIAMGQILRWLRAVAVTEQPKNQHERRGGFWYTPGRLGIHKDRLASPT